MPHNATMTATKETNEKITAANTRKSRRQNCWNNIWSPYQPKANERQARRHAGHTKVKTGEKDDRMADFLRSLPETEEEWAKKKVELGFTEGSGIMGILHLLVCSDCQATSILDFLQKRAASVTSHQPITSLIFFAMCRIAWREGDSESRKVINSCLRLFRNRTAESGEGSRKINADVGETTLRLYRDVSLHITELSDNLYPQLGGRAFELFICSNHTISRYYSLLRSDLKALQQTIIQRQKHDTNSLASSLLYLPFLVWLELSINVGLDYYDDVCSGLSATLFTHEDFMAWKHRYYAFLRCKEQQPFPPLVDEDDFSLYGQQNRSTLTTEDSSSMNILEDYDIWHYAFN